ncbi:MAG TPA: hypothetical protein VGN97_15535 [Mesorhizobium sp.]|jgi:prophage regulatory protein|nr:hypothetical protein [Mesorhizobium sp.]
MSLIPLSRLPDKGILYSRNYIDRLVKNQLLPELVYLSPRKRAFIEEELDRVVAARAAGKSVAEIKALVAEMTASRSRNKGGANGTS